MKNDLVMLMALCLMTTARAGVTSHFKLDCRTGARECPVEGVCLRYDASWCENGDGVRITDNGALLTNGVNGTYVWVPQTCSSTRHLFKLEVLSGGQIVGIETSEFKCDAPTSGHVAVVSQPATEPTSGNPGMTAEVRCSKCGEIIQSATEIAPALGYIRNVSARQLWPHKKVEVCYTLADDIGELVSEGEGLVLLGIFNEASMTARAVLGDTSCKPGLHRVVWDVESDGIAQNLSDARFIAKYAGVSGSSAGTSVNTTSAVCDGMSVGPNVEIGYSPIDAGSVAVEVNGRELVSSAESGTFVWSPERPGTYVLTHRSDEIVFTRKLIVPVIDDRKDLEVGWLDGPISNLFPNAYALITNVDIASDMTDLPIGAFAGCADLFSVSLPSICHTIGEKAFQHCTRLYRITGLSYVKHIGPEAFSYNTELQDVVLGDGVYVCMGAFGYCPNLLSIRLLGQVTFEERAVFSSEQVRLIFDQKPDPSMVWPVISKIVEETDLYPEFHFISLQRFTYVPGGLGVDVFPWFMDENVKFK